jgi:hypothetical protein
LGAAFDVGVRPQDEAAVMPAAASSPPLVYVECDVPEGMTLDAWRRARTPDRDARPARLRLARLTRRRRRPAGAGR